MGVRVGRGTIERMNPYRKTKVLAGVIALGIVGALAASSPAISAAVTTMSTSGGGVNPVTSVRILDSRGTNGGHNVAFTAGETFALPVAGRGGVPLSGASAIFGNVTIVSGANSGYVTLFPTGTTRPLASNINFSANTVIANAFLVPLGSDGSISIYSFAAAVHVIIDVQGWVQQVDVAASAMGPSVPFVTAALTAPDSVKAATILANTNKYAMNTWWNGSAQTMLASDLGATVADDAVRRLSMEALSLSTALATGAYDPVTAGTSAVVAKQRAVQLVSTVSSWHVTSHLNGWGDGWQSPMWAGLVGRAAWFIWSDLPAATQMAVARMVEHEADYAMQRQIHYLRDAAGNVITAGDSGAEEVSWWTNAMQLALVMLPNHPHVTVWRTELIRFSLAAWAKPADVFSSTVVNGKALSAWITGSNVESNGLVINHGRVASDYSTTIYQNLDAVGLFALAGQQTPQAIRELLGPVYAAFTGYNFSVPPYAAPGGTTYVPGSEAIYYPEVNDWGSGQRLPYALADALALTCGFDPGSAASYLDLHLDAVLAQQARYSTGMTYANNVEYNYIGREEHTAQLASQLYLILYLRDHNMISFSNV